MNDRYSPQVAIISIGHDDDGRRKIPKPRRLVAVENSTSPTITIPGTSVYTRLHVTPSSSTLPRSVRMWRAAVLIVSLVQSTTSTNDTVWIDKDTFQFSAVA